MEKITKVSVGTYKIKSFTDPNVGYEVIKDAGTGFWRCNCMAFTKGGKRPCKHIQYLFKEMDLKEEKVEIVKRTVVASALVKTIRLGLPKEAAYWATIAKEIFGGWYSMRRIVFSAGEDNLNFYVWRAVWEVFFDKRYNAAPIEAAYIAESAKRYGWYVFQEGRDSIRNWLTAHKMNKSNSFLLCEEDIMENEVNFARWFLEGCEKNIEETLKKCYEMLKARSISDIFDEALLILRRTIPDAVKYKDGNSASPLIFWYFHGMIDEEIEIDEDFYKKIEEVAIKDLEKNTVRKPPNWALDGRHTGGYDWRFSGTWAGIEFMYKMGSKYNRLDPSLTL